MSWGYSKGFVLEHDSTLKKKIDCKDCIYYESFLYTLNSEGKQP